MPIMRPCIEMNPVQQQAVYGASITGFLPRTYAPLAQWIECWSSEPAMWVQIPRGAPVRKLQTVSVRLASLGDYFVRDFGGKNELAVSQNMVRADVFRQVLWRFLSVRLRRIFGFSRGAFLAACGGEMRSDYFKNTAPAKMRGESLRG